MFLSDQLKTLGLNNSEITVYLFLLENGVSTPPIVSRETKIARTNCYNILVALQGMSLIEEREVGKRKAYAAHDPESLLRSVENKRTVIQEILPDLRGMYRGHKNKPLVKYYDGVDQIKNLFEESLESKTVFYIGSLSNLEKEMPTFISYYSNEVGNRGINFHEILQNGDLPANTLIWDDKIALIAWEEPLFATVLVNEAIALSFKTICESLLATK